MVRADLLRAQLVRRFAEVLSDGGNGVPVLAGVEGELVAAQLAALPADVERMLQHVPAAPGLVDSGTEFHEAPLV